MQGIPIQLGAHGGGLMAWEQVLLIPLRNSLGHLDLTLLHTVEFLSL